MQRLENERMKRTLTITMAVALIGSLMFMGFAGTAAAQNNNNVDDVDDVEDIADVNVDADFAEQDQTAETNIDIQQETSNEQIGIAEAQTDVAALNMGGAAAAPAAAPADKKKGGAAAQPAQAPADGGASAVGASDATVNQVQDHDQSNTANVENVTTQTGDNIQDASVSLDLEDFDLNDNNNND